MSISFETRPGTWCDVDPGVMAYVAPGATPRVYAVVNGVVRWSIPEPSPPSLYLRVAMVDGVVCVVVQGQDGIAWLTVDGRSWLNYGRTFGADCFLVLPDKGRFRFLVFRDAPGDHYSDMYVGLDGTKLGDEFIFRCDATTQGFLDWNPVSGYPVMTDKGRLGPYGLLKPNRDGELAACQHPKRWEMWGAGPDTKGGIVPFKIADGLTHQPRVAMERPGVWTVVTRSDGYMIVATCKEPFAYEDPKINDDGGGGGTGGGTGGGETGGETTVIASSIFVDGFDPNKVVVDRDADSVMSWPKTSKPETVSSDGDEVVFEHSKAGEWPAVSYGDIKVEGVIWWLVQYGGHIHAATFDRLRVGQTRKSMGADEFDKSWVFNVPGLEVPKGTIVGLMVSTPARDGDDWQSTRHERSPVVFVRYGTGVKVGEEGGGGDTGNGVDDSAEIAALKEEVATLRRAVDLLTARLDSFGAQEQQQTEMLVNITQGLTGVLRDGDEVALRTVNGKYVCAELGGGGEVNATRDSGGAWETFGLEKK